MSTSIINLYTYIGKRIIIYVGTTILLAGVLGGILNIIVFISLHTFRQNSCAFYLTIMSVVNLGQLFTGILSRIMITIYNSDGSEYSLIYCKLRGYIATVCSSISWTCFCLGVIDQYCATCSQPRLRKYCNIKFAQRLIILFTIIWILHGIPYLIFNNHILSSNTGIVTCTMTNTIYLQYRAYFLILILWGFLPVSISILFGLMAYINIKQIAYYALPLVRRELDKQLTVMILTQIIVDCFVIIPFIIVDVFQLNINFINDSFVKAQIQLSYNITLTISYLYFACPFYIYICVSERFRRQLIYVLFKIHFNRCKRQPRIINNQVTP